MFFGCSPDVLRMFAGFFQDDIRMLRLVFWSWWVLWSFQMKVWSKGTQWSPTIPWSQLFNDPQLFNDQLEVWTLIIQKSTVIPPSPMILFFFVIQLPPPPTQFDHLMWTSIVFLLVFIDGVKPNLATKLCGTSDYQLLRSEGINFILWTWYRSNQVLDLTNPFLRTWTL